MINVQRVTVEMDRIAGGQFSWICRLRMLKAKMQLKMHSNFFLHYPFRDETVISHQQCWQGAGLLQQERPMASVTLTVGA